jgi:hypothetical protein
VVGIMGCFRLILLIYLVSKMGMVEGDYSGVYIGFSHKRAF